MNEYDVDFILADIAAVNTTDADEVNDVLRRAYVAIKNLSEICQDLSWRLSEALKGSK